MISGALAMSLFLGCGRGIEYEGGPGAQTETAAPTVVACGDESTWSEGYRVEGVVSDIETGAALAAGLCATAIDPTPAVTGGDPTLLASAAVCEDGRFVIAGLTEAPAIGLFIGIDDCDNTVADTVMNAATGVSAEEIEGKGDGDAVSGVVAVVVRREVEAQWATDLAYAGSLEGDGFLAGFILDVGEQPVSGAQIDCSGCAEDYYLDADASDGLFGTASGFNPSSDAAAGAMFLLPAAPVFTFTCADGGAHTWENRLFGSVPGIGAFIDVPAVE
jgi:hypothetical protein